MHINTLFLTISLTLSATRNIYAQHIPLIDSNGLPLDTAELQAAKQRHFDAVGDASYHYPSYENLYNGAYTQGFPLDTYEVAATKNQHYHDYAVAALRNTHPPVHLQPSFVLGYFPVDPVEVEIAKTAHLVAHANALAFHGRAKRRRRSIYNYAVIGSNGQPIETPAHSQCTFTKQSHFAAHSVVGNPHYSPLHPFMDTPEVQAAKASHFAAHFNSISRTGGYHHPIYNNLYSFPNRGLADTPEVQAEKIHHFAAHAVARARQY